MGQERENDYEQTGTARTRVHLLPSGIDGHAQHGALVAEHLDQGRRHVGTPQGDGTVGVAQVHDGIVRVLRHGIAATEARS